MQKYKGSIKRVHDKKLQNLGASAKLSSCDPSKVIFNYSDRTLSNRENFLLSFGLDFNLPIHKLSYQRFFIAFEKMIYQLKHCKLAQGANFKTLIEQIKHKAKEGFYGFKLYYFLISFFFTNATSTQN